MTEHVLVVEDEVDLATALEYSLKKDGFEVSIAHDGASALSRLEKQPRPNAVVLDLMLPDMGGLDICRHIRKSPSLSDVPVLNFDGQSGRDRPCGRLGGRGRRLCHQAFLHPRTLASHQSHSKALGGQQLGH